MIMWRRTFLYSSEQARSTKQAGQTRWPAQLPMPLANEVARPAIHPANTWAKYFAEIERRREGGEQD